jgi:hypothetical protein
MGDVVGSVKVTGFSNPTGAAVLRNGTVDIWQDADTAPGLTVEAGATVSFQYLVTNAGSLELANVTVVDDNGTPGDASDDFAPMPVLVGGYNVGDVDQDGRLDVGELWVYTAEETALPGQHTSVATVSGTPVLPDGAPIASVVTDSDAANYSA